MNSIMVADKTSIDSANADSYAGIVGHSDLKDGIYQKIVNCFEYHDRIRPKRIVTMYGPCFLVIC
jgi:exosome complex RNA-binding protein Csl4